MEIVIPQEEREKDVFEVKINFRDLTVSKNDIVQILGYADRAIPVHFEEMIDDILSRLPNYCDIQAGYRILDVKKFENRSEGLYIGNEFFKLQKIVTSQLRKSEKAALFISTIGPAMETWAKKLSAEGDVALSYLVDTVASVTEEQAVDVLHNHIEKHMNMQGFKITNRYSPGYCNWSVSEQHLLFSFFPVNFCGITLTESALMVPIKSVSGIIGIGRDVQRMDYICDKCSIQDCTYRMILEAKKGHSKSKH
jgi:hypothetical protein